MLEQFKQTKTDDTIASKIKLAKKKDKSKLRSVWTSYGIATGFLPFLDLYEQL